MKNLPLALTAAGALLVVSAMSAEKPGPPTPSLNLVATINDVVDGDTLDVSVTHSFRVRLIDCWAPETRGEEKERGLEAKRHMIRLAAGKDAVVTIPLHDDLSKSLTLGRVLGRVHVIGQEKDLSTQMIESGHATKEKAGP